MKTTILLFCLLGSTLSLPMQLNPVLGLPPTKLVPDQATLRNQQQPNQVFPSLSLIPLTQMLTLGSDLQLLNPAIGMVPGSQTLPLTLGALNVQQQLQPQMIPVIVAHLGTQGAILSSEELPANRQILTGLIFHTLFPGAILPPSPANPDAQNGIHPAGQAGANPAIQGTPRGPFPTSSGTDDDFDETTPAGLQRGTHATEETTTGSPNDETPMPHLSLISLRNITLENLRGHKTNEDIQILELVENDNGLFNSGCMICLEYKAKGNNTHRQIPYDITYIWKIMYSTKESFHKKENHGLGE